MSAEFVLKVTIGEKSVSINDILYDNITYSEDFEPEFDTGFVEHASHLDSISGNNELSEYIKTLKNHKGCYILKTEVSPHQESIYALYIIDGIYYFVSVSEGRSVIRIHRADPNAQIESLTVYVSQQSENSYLYKVLTGVPDDHSMSDIMGTSNKSLENAINIIELYSKNYDIPNNKITVAVWQDPFSSYLPPIFVHDKDGNPTVDRDEYIAQQRELLGLN